MQYYSLHNKAPKVSFSEAVIKGLAPDKGLYFPESITSLPKSFFDNIENLDTIEIGFQTIKQFVGDEIPETELRDILTDVLSFDFPVIDITKNIGTLELFHGPTMAFKDVGARFMARCLGYFNRNNDDKVTVLVATSGDTGGAVAQGFLGVKGVDVVILYPSGKVSDIQERQLTTLGQNITALEIDGVFDDCQDMVKKAFLDESITNHMQLTSANSINIARWLPQLFYFVFAYKQLKSKGKEIVFSVPSGNFGNICAGIVAHKLGLPVKHFVAATNVNDTVVRYMKTANYEPKPSKATISNAMDVGNPSNFIRIQQLFDNKFESLKDNFSAYSFDDAATRDAMKEIYNQNKYIADPHGAVGYLGLKEYDLKDNEYGVFLETAHPVKFLDIVETTLDIKIPIPAQIQKVMNKPKVRIKTNDYKKLKEFLLK
ncbi:threonine synthase [Aquimarina sp. BL5]|uniref:threonine synthase n=1 Tax=Aquimarina sp. BL5 TaxID=1714860 RepID=UPI000E4BFF3B|nr:threonine synthase [Aquimarina sp. BL5]AXT49529.1 threonine synthase [Aquimarina sp. BL5]RKM99861.1 threonine synthase [Aquimarina sp. BL5]